MNVRHLTTAELEAGLDVIRQAPRDEGVLEMIVRRPCVDGREILDAGELSIAEGLVGDSWRLRSSSRTPDRTAHPDTQLNIMNARAIDLVAGFRERWPLAGDQLYIDMDLGAENLPPWTRLEIGSALIEVTDQPHTGCHKFMARFGRDALEFVNSLRGRALNLRGINARVVRAGAVRVGDTVRKGTTGT